MFEEYYSGSGNSPRWFSILMHIFFNLIKVACLYYIAKFISIEAALLAYVVFAGIIEGIDGYSEHKNLNMLIWNDEQLYKKLHSLEEAIKRNSNAVSK